ncbi:MAG: hypothetical protein ACREEM_02560 [Blastocatellia bacterium]
MIAQAVPKISAHEAQATANLFLSTHMPEYFRAGEPIYDQTSQVWRVPVLLDYGYASPFGEVGQLVINAFAAEVISHTPLTEMQELGRKLYQQHSRSRAAAFAADENAPAVTKTAAFQAQAAVNGFILDHLPDRFCADDPHFDAAANVWRVPVILAYLYVGSLGQVGEVVVNANTETILSHTPFDEMKAHARSLYEQNREKLEAAFLQARNA